MACRSLLSSLLVGTFACSGPEPVAVTPVTGPAPTANPFAALAPADTSPWSGVVQERLAAGSYSYLAVREGDALRWVAVMGPGQPPGTAVAVHALGMRKDFHSPRLDRDFDELVFATVEPTSKG